MTLDIEAIRTRDADFGAWLDAHPGSELYDTANADRRDLLVEVDRLWQQVLDLATEATELDTALMSARQAERNRIRQGVQLLAGFHLDYTHMNETKVVALDVVHRSQVMGVIDERALSDPFPPIAEPVKVTQARHDA
jgi:hypothetical protein